MPGVLGGSYVIANQPGPGRQGIRRGARSLRKRCRHPCRRAVAGARRHRAFAAALGLDLTRARRSRWLRWAITERLRRILMRVKSTSGSTSLHSMAPPSSFGVTIRASALATGWQLLSRQGRPRYRGETGERGVRGEKGDRGEPGATVVLWQLDRERYRVSPLMSDGKVGPMLELRPMFEQFLAEVAS